MPAERSAGIPNITVSLTSYPPRIGYVGRVVENMMAQTLRPDRIVLWLAPSQFPKQEAELPYSVTKLVSEGLEIRWCDDWKSYKKLVPSLLEFPDDIIITVDDDLVYDDQLIETLVDSYERHPEAVSTVRTHLMRFDEDGEVCDYKNWRMDYSLVDEPSMCLFATTGAGTLFPPGIFGEHMTDPDNFMNLCPRADDVWVKVMQTFYGIPTVLARPVRPLRYIPDSQSVTLYEDNLLAGGNDEQLRAAFKYYDTLLNGETMASRLSEQSPGLCPELAVVVLGASDMERFRRCMDSIKAQTRYGILTVCVYGGAGEKALALSYEDGRTEVVEAIDPSMTGRIFAGLTYAAESGADYVMVLTERDTLAPNASKEIYNQLTRTPCAMLAMTGAVTGCGSVDDMTLSLEARDGEIIENLAKGGMVGSDLHTKALSPALCRRAAQDIGSVSINGTDGERFAARVLMLSAGSAAAFRGYGLITRELSPDEKRGREFIVEMNRAGGKLAAMGCENRMWLLGMRERIFSQIVNADDCSAYYDSLCDVFSEPLAIEKLIKVYNGRAGEMLECVRAGKRHGQPSSLVSPRRLVIIDAAASERLALMVEACLNTVSSALVLSDAENAQQLAGERITVQQLGADGGVQKMLENAANAVSRYDADGVQVIGKCSAETAALLMLSEISSKPIMLCVENGQPTGNEGLYLWQLAEEARVTIVDNEEDASLLRMLDKATAVCVPDTDSERIDTESVSSDELDELSEKLFSQDPEKQLSSWREAYKLLEKPSESKGKDQPLRRAVRALTAAMSEAGDKARTAILHSKIRYTEEAAAAIEENLRAAIGDGAERSAEKLERSAKNAEEAKGRLSRALQGRIDFLEGKKSENEERIKSLEQMLTETGHQLDLARRAERAARAENEEIRNSGIYKAGRFVTWLPRKLKKLISKG